MSPDIVMVSSTDDSAANTTRSGKVLVATRVLVACLCGILFTVPILSFAVEMASNHQAIIGSSASLYHQAPDEIALGRPLVNLRLESLAPSPLKTASVSAIATATADFNLDGVPDLAVAYRIDQGWGVGILAGNPETIHRSRKANHGGALFESVGELFELPSPPEFLGTGDFNADGYPDVVAAEIGGVTLNFLKGDGRGGFMGSELVEMPGNITAITAGEVNRKDGLADLVVGINGGGKSFLLVYEGPYGALRLEPEQIDLPLPAREIVLGHLNQQMEVDLAVAAGPELVIISGRDRQLSGLAERREAVPPPQVQNIPVSGTVTSLAIGDFILEAEYRMELALLVNGKVEFWAADAADDWAPLSVVELPKNLVGTVPDSARLMRTRMSSNSTDDVLVTGGSDPLVHLISLGPGGQPQYSQPLAMSTGTNSILPMRLGPGAQNDLVITTQDLAMPQALVTGAVNTWVVDSELDELECNLADGICNSGPELGVCTGTCTLNAALANANLNADLDAIEFNHAGPHTPNLDATYPVIIDGTSMQTTPGVPVVEFDRQITLTGGSSVVRGVVIYTFEKAPGSLLLPTLEFSGAGSNLVEGCYIGTNASGATQISAELGIGVLNSNDNIIGGTTTSTRNVIVSGEYGIHIVVSSANQVIGNYIGTDSTGTVDINSGSIGVYLQNSPGNDIGGSATGAGNLISGWVTGDFLIGGIVGYPASSSLIQGNFIGTDVSGLSAMGNGNGVYMILSNSVNLGGTAPGAGNLISGNLGGAFFASGEGNGVIQGNLIGTNIAGTAVITNGSDPAGGRGVDLNPGYNDTLIGGAVAPSEAPPPAAVAAAQASGSNLVPFPVHLGPRNVIVGEGVHFRVGINAGGSRTQILGNFVGVGVDGEPLGDFVEVRIFDLENLLGGAEVGAGNVIAGGVWIWSGSIFNKIRGNRICTDASGTKSAGVESYGIVIRAPDNIIGGTLPGEGNLISGCSGRGMEIGWSQSETAERTIVQGNIIGLDATGTQLIGNGQSGIGFFNGEDTIIGGPEPGARNVISGNQWSGIYIAGQGIKVQGNHIGTDITGTIGFGNGGGNNGRKGGIYIFDSATDVLIGGTQAGEGNLISGNHEYGIYVQGKGAPAPPATGVEIYGNRIGTDFTGTAAIPNIGNGILFIYAQDNMIGSKPGGGNIIGFNTGNGIHLNWISTNNPIGSVAAGAGNTIAFNGLQGIQIEYDSGGTISGNSIHSNGKLGIELRSNYPGQNLPGVNPNDQLDLDDGGNLMQNYPELTSASSGTIDLMGTLHSTPDSGFTIEFFSNSECDSSGHGEGEFYLGSIQVATNNLGNAEIDASLDAQVPGGSFITATATDASGNTSEFSACVQASDLIFSNGFEITSP